MSVTDAVPDAPGSILPPRSIAQARARQVPKWSELKGLLNVAPPAIRPADRRQARLARAADIGDVRCIAKRVPPTGPFEYVDGAANGEQTHHRNRATFAGLELRPRVLVDVGEVDLSVDIFGQRSALPVGLAGSRE